MYTYTSCKQQKCGEWAVGSETVSLNPVLARSCLLCLTFAMPCVLLLCVFVSVSVYCRVRDAQEKGRSQKGCQERTLFHLNWRCTLVVGCKQGRTQKPLRSWFAMHCCTLGRRLTPSGSGSRSRSLRSCKSNWYICRSNYSRPSKKETRKRCAKDSAEAPVLLPAYLQRSREQWGILCKFANVGSRFVSLFKQVCFRPVSWCLCQDSCPGLCRRRDQWGACKEIISSFPCHRCIAGVWEYLCCRRVALARARSRGCILQMDLMR